MPALTVFLAGAECPFTCVFCDLWRHTLDQPTPPGAIPVQLEAVLDEERGRIAGSARGGAAVKLYNASNFFDRRAVPPDDDARIAALLAPFRRVTVECHTKLIGARCLAFAERLAGRLEVAIGLETIHPEAAPKLNKGASLDDFDRAARTLREAGIGIRAFVLVGAPFVPESESVEWAVRSAEYAWRAGADRVSLIPVRGGNGAMEALSSTGLFHPPSLSHLEEALEASLAARPESVTGAALVEADLWDAERFAACRRCAGPRIERLRRLNLTGLLEAPVACDACGGGHRTGG